MKLTPAELAFVRSKGLYITEKCDGCGKALNQSFRYTIINRAEVYCSAVCRDTVFFGGRDIAERVATPGKCATCGASLAKKRRGTMFCSEACCVRFSRKNAARPNSTDSAPVESRA